MVESFTTRRADSVRKPPCKEALGCQVFILLIELNLLLFFRVLFLGASNPMYPSAHKCSPTKLRCSAFTHVATRQLAHQPEADFVGRLQHIDCSSCCHSSLVALGSYRRRTCLISHETRPMDHDSTSHQG